jgi:hypothetical protein
LDKPKRKNEHGKKSGKEINHLDVVSFIACLQVEGAIFRKQSLKLKAGSQKKKGSNTLVMEKQTSI